MEYRKLKDKIIAVDYDRKELHIFESEDELLEFEKNKFKLDKINSKLSANSYINFCKRGLKYENDFIDKIEREKVKKLWINTSYFAIPIAASALALVGHYKFDYTLAPEVLTVAWTLLVPSLVFTAIFNLNASTDAIYEKGIHEKEKERLEKTIADGPTLTDQEKVYLESLKSYYTKKNNFLEEEAKLPIVKIQKNDEEELSKELEKELEYYYVKEKKKK